MVAVYCQRPSLSWAPQGYICRRFSSSMGDAVDSHVCDIKPPIGAPHLISPPGYPVKSFLQRDSGGEKFAFYLYYVSCRRLTSITTSCDNYTIGKMVPKRGLRIRRINYIPWLLLPFGWASKGKATDPLLVDLPAIYHCQRR